MPRSVLLTGGAGYIGSHTYVALVEAGYDVVIIDDFSNASESVPNRLSQITEAPVAIETGSILDPEFLDRVFQTHDIAAVIHFAAFKSVGESCDKPLEYAHNNIAGLTTLLTAMDKGEDPSGIPANLMPYVAKVATGELEALSVFGDDYPTADGTGVRDYIHVCDLADGHVKSLAALHTHGAGHTVNLGTGQGYSVLELLAAYERACGRKLPYRIAPRRSGDPAASYADPSLAKSLLGFEATRGLDDMCASSWAWVTARHNTKNESKFTPR